MKGFRHDIDGEELVINDYEIDEDEVHLITTQGRASFLIKDWQQEIAKFIPLEGANGKMSTLPATPQIFPENCFSDLTHALMESIQKVQSDPEYAKQATVINNSAKQIIAIGMLQVNAARVSIEERRLLIEKSNNSPKSLSPGK